jgi:hypothetical protein
MKKIKTGSEVVVKFSSSKKSPINAHKVYKVESVDGDELKLMNVDKALPLSMFEPF